MNERAPEISVILPAYNSQATIGLCLEALRQQSFKDFEVIVVNSSQEPSTAEIVTQGFPEVVFHQAPERLLPHGAGNLALKSARGSYLVFSDPDAIPHSDWLEKLMAARRDSNVVIQGAMGLHQSSWLSQGIHLCKWHALLPGLPAHGLWLVATGNALYPRSIVEEVGPFDGDLFSGDALMSWRAAAAGAELCFDPAPVVDQNHEGDLVSLARERWSRGLEFGQVRIAKEKWSSTKTLVTLVLLPLVILKVLATTGIASARAGWFGVYLVTFPVHFVGHVAWILGEGWAQLQRLLGINPPMAVTEAAARK